MDEDAIADALAAASEAFPGTVARLRELVRIPSCSFPGFAPAELVRSAEACAGWLRAVGFEEVAIVTDSGPFPSVIARDHRAGPDRPTVLLYAHHDVQPPLDEREWRSPPFEPTERDGRLYGRGAADDKAGVAAIAGACGAWLSRGRLPVNVTVLIEGEEEIGSPHIADLVERHREELSADCLVIADLVNVAVGVPTLTVSLRGLIAWRVTLRALAHPLHSGMWGGAAPDPAGALCRMLAALADERDRLRVPGVAVPEPDPAMLADLARVPFDRDAFADAMGALPAYRARMGDGAALYRAAWYEATVAVNALRAGGEPGQAGNVIVDHAWARLGVRLAPGMAAAATADAIERRLRELTPPGMELALERDAVNDGWRTATGHPAFAVAREAFRRGYGSEPVAVGCGGSIPFVTELSGRLGGVPALLVPVEDPDTRAHGANESVHLGDLERTTRSLAAFLGLLADGA